MGLSSFSLRRAHLTPFPTPYEEVPLVLVVEGEHGSGIGAGGADRRCSEHLRRLHHQRPAGGLVRVLGRQEGSGACEERKDLHAVHCERGHERRDVCERGRTQADSGGGGCTYTKPLEVDYILITPGQTTNVLLKADQAVGRYYLAARPYIAPNVTLDNTTTTVVIVYEGVSKAGRPAMPKLPAISDSPSADSFSKSLRSLALKKFPAPVPQQVDRQLFFTVGLAIRPCANCTLGGRLVGVINNISFQLPETALLQAHYFRKPNVFVTNFPDNPTASFNYTGKPLANIVPKAGTRLSYLSFNSTVQLVLQSTSLVAPENHPIHLHGTNFFVVGMGTGNYNASSDPLSFNLVDTPERNTIGVPQGGWAALRFHADNPGVWFMHCHLEFHTSAGLETAFVIEDGPNQVDRIIAPPPAN
ncbi:hypothetical protein L7F22_020673 [Adiantum nelumboides]|nr:hypothetical protein [Adiantum nelumboides]